MKRWAKTQNRFTKAYRRKMFEDARKVLKAICEDEEITLKMEKELWDYIDCREQEIKNSEIMLAWYMKGEQPMNSTPMLDRENGTLYYGKQERSAYGKRFS